MARRGAKGSIVKRGKCYYIVYYTPDGKQKWESGFPTRTKASDRLRDILGDIAEGTYQERKPIRFKEFADQQSRRASGKGNSWPCSGGIFRGTSSGCGIHSIGPTGTARPDGRCNRPSRNTPGGMLTSPRE